VESGSSSGFFWYGFVIAQISSGLAYLFENIGTQACKINGFGTQIYPAAGICILPHEYFPAQHHDFCRKIGGIAEEKA
jgi:hypothetical protein